MILTSTLLRLTASKLNFKSFEFGKIVPLLMSLTCGFRASKRSCSEKAVFNL